MPKKKKLEQNFKQELGRGELKAWIGDNKIIFICFREEVVEEEELQNKTKQ